MPPIPPTTPLAAIDAAVIDTETTGLDARHARVVQIAAVLVSGGRLEAKAALDTLVDPGIPIPPATTAIHGIGDDDVRGMPAFPAVAGSVASLLEGRLLVGHSLAYDLAVLKREHDLAGLRFDAPRALDVRPLARLVAPSLADHSLDRLCEWLGIAIQGRHTARGDAMATAEVLLRLVPMLREKGIRTLAEATAATARLAEQEARASRGLIVVDGGVPADEEPRGPIDSFAYRHRVRDVMSAPPLVVEGSETLAHVLDLILARGTSSVFVSLPGGTGIVTERDVLRAVGSGGAGALGMPVSAVAKSPVHGVGEDDFVYRAIGRMARLGIRHLAVRDADGAVTGALTPRNLLRDRAMQAIVIGDAIAAATSAPELAAAWGKAPEMAAALRRDGVEARAVAATLSAEIAALTGRAAELAEAGMMAAGRGAPPVPYAVLVLGSAGRGESLLAADQDNAIVYAEGGEGSPADQWMLELATRMNSLLDEAGIPLCKGGVMARNRPWRQAVGDWRTQVETWIRRQRPQDLLDVDIFFDSRVVAGDRALAAEVLDFARARAKASPSFLMMLTELARQWRSPVTILGGFHKVDGRVDLKKGGLMPIFTGARVLALRHGIAELATRERL
ncbi:MAG: DUF294 nucleotidyltransferase-like domain-containing protein, partial [Hyphomicrobiaceae bacterium]